MIPARHTIPASRVYAQPRIRFEGREQGQIHAQINGVRIERYLKDEGIAWAGKVGQSNGPLLVRAGKVVFS